MTTWRPVEYLMRCDVCGVTVALALMPKGWQIEAGLNPDGTVDLVHAKHLCPLHAKAQAPGAGSQPK